MPLLNDFLHLRCSHSRTELSSQVFMALLGQVLQLAKGKRLRNWIRATLNFKSSQGPLHTSDQHNSVDRATRSPPRAGLCTFTLQIKGLEVCVMSFHADKREAACSARSHPLLTSRCPLPSRSPRTSPPPAAASSSRRPFRRHSLAALRSGVWISTIPTNSKWCSV